MDQIFNFVLTQLLIYGYPVIISVIVLAYLGLPVPLNAIIVAAGAFAQDESMNILLLIPLVFMVASLGDVVQYYLGIKYGYKVINFISLRFGLSQTKIDEVDRLFQKWGGGFIFITRWLLTPLGIPVNVLAGVQQYSFKKFIAIIIIGELIWTSLYVSIGYYLGANWVLIQEYINDAPTFLAAIALSVMFLYLGYKAWLKHTIA